MPAPAAYFINKPITRIASNKIKSSVIRKSTIFAAVNNTPEISTKPIKTRFPVLIYCFARPYFLPAFPAKFVTAVNCHLGHTIFIRNGYILRFISVHVNYLVFVLVPADVQDPADTFYYRSLP